MDTSLTGSCALLLLLMMLVAAESPGEPLMEKAEASELGPGPPGCELTCGVGSRRMLGVLGVLGVL